MAVLAAHAGGLQGQRIAACKYSYVHLQTNNNKGIKLLAKFVNQTTNRVLHAFYSARHAICISKLVSLTTIVSIRS